MCPSLYWNDYEIYLLITIYQWFWSIVGRKYKFESWFFSTDFSTKITWLLLSFSQLFFRCLYLIILKSVVLFYQIRVPLFFFCNFYEAEELVADDFFDVLLDLDLTVSVFFSVSFPLSRTLAMVSAEVIFALYSRWLYKLAVIEKFECPSHSCIAFMGTSFASKRLAQEWRRSWKRKCFIPFLSTM